MNRWIVECFVFLVVFCLLAFFDFWWVIGPCCALFTYYRKRRVLSFFLPGLVVSFFTAIGIIFFDGILGQFERLERLTLLLELPISNWILLFFLILVVSLYCFLWSGLGFLLAPPYRAKEPFLFI